MALVPVYEEIAVCNEVISPGSMWGEVSEKCRPDGQNDIKMKNILEYSVKCSTGKALQGMCNSKTHKEVPWLQDLSTIKCENVIFVEVTKISEKKASDVEFPGKPVVTSVRSKGEGKMLLIFSQPVDAQKIPDLQCMIENALVKDSKSYILGDLDTNFNSAILYFNLATLCINNASLKTSVEELCSHINSFVPQYVTSAVVLKGYAAMDGSGTKEISEQAENIMPHGNPRDYASKGGYSVNPKHEADLGNPNSTRCKDTFGSVSHIMNQTVLNAEVQDETLSRVSQSYDEKFSNSQRSCQQDAKTLLNQHCPGDAYKMRQFHREENPTYEFGSHGNHKDRIETCSDSNSGNMYPQLDKIEEPMDTGYDGCYSHCLQNDHTLTPQDGSHGNDEDRIQTCSDLNSGNMHPRLVKIEESMDAGYDGCYSCCLQDSNTLTPQDQDASTSGKCSDSEGKHPYTEHNLIDLKGRYPEFCSMKAESVVDCSGLRRQYFGCKSNSAEEKVIALIGNKGSGKTTLINFAANFFKGIEITDEKLFLVTMNHIDENPHTNAMTAYTFCFAEDDVPITIIDTPGMEDIRGAEKDNPLQTLKTFFTSSGSNIQLHAIGYVISSTAEYLTSSERHMIDFLTEHYGQGISTNLITFVTFAADTGKTQPVIDILQNQGVKSKNYLKFNNTVFSMKEIDDFDEVYWKRGIKNWKKCIKVLKELPPLTIKTFKVQQKLIYSTQLIKSLENKLKNELKGFILSFKEVNKLTQTVQEKSEQVWQATISLYHLLSYNDCTVSDVESVLVKYVDEVAKENSFNSKYCVMILSLCPSRGLLEAGKRVIKCLAPVYDKTVAYGIQKAPLGKKPEFLHCRKCHKEHKIKRVESKAMKPDEAITYHCLTCNCDESEHVKTPTQSRREKKPDLPRDCLKHTKNAIESILQEFSIPGHVLSMKTYLEFVSQNVDEQFKDFIDYILKS